MELGLSIFFPANSPLFRYAQQTWFGEFRYPQERYNMDQWGGYTPQRARLIDELANPKLDNLVILNGDWHCGAGFDVLKDFSRPDFEKIAAELADSKVVNHATLRVEAGKRGLDID